MKLTKGDKIGIIACSDPLTDECRTQIKELLFILKELGLKVDVSPYLYNTDSPILLRGKLGSVKFDMKN